MAYQFDNLIGASDRPLREIGAAMKLLGDFVVTHRIGWTALTEISAPRDHTPVFQVDFEDRRHLVVSRLFGLGVDTEMDAIDHRLDVGSVDDGVGEFAESRFALNQQDSGGIVTAAKSVEEAAVSFQYLFGASPTQSRQVSGKDSDLGRMAGVE